MRVTQSFTYENQVGNSFTATFQQGEIIADSGLVSTPLKWYFEGLSPRKVEAVRYMKLKV